MVIPGLTAYVDGCEVLRRLRVAYLAARRLTERDSNEVVQAWSGRNVQVPDGPTRARPGRPGDETVL